MARSTGAALLAVLSLQPLVSAHVAYQGLLPNALNVYKTVALGHVTGTGGGELNAFGLAFKAHNFVWTKELCEEDSDGDGESNGLELGDPCCRWVKGGSVQPDRAWQLSHPGKTSDKSKFEPPNCAAAELVVEEETAVAGGDPLSSESYTTFYYGKTFVSGAAAAPDTAAKKSQPIMTQTRLPGSILFGLGLSLILFTNGTAQAIWNQSLPRRAATLFLGFVLVDNLSASLHLVLDNPRFNTWPVIGVEAQHFQGHHNHPWKIAEEPILPFVCGPHAGMLLIVATILINRKHQGLRILSTYILGLIHIMMLSHRWAHTPPAEVPFVPRICQQLGLLVSHEHHSMHHATFDNNYAIFAGIVDPFFNFIVRSRVLDERSRGWLTVLAIVALAPALVSRFTRYLDWIAPEKEESKSAVAVEYEKDIAV
mmetsp:Transcript_28299/g.92371  ORF Transcript_28299/g.92371 Transcript_28299/m.92371 type:complete len:425 (-) Transcript_28299:212-1486(-)|eukprot:CAMPEP_0170135402 /NCGR_PEP_ID=MMETSP0033_2-20121228/2457_1 /TAXON_ID=195969 /ORGANISM="Dolichomastix tenuilepis, Strain CCMP3274" /LENGTH=424 /DNA_ID=CAMNT_0010371001 /DNA_START=30 /DNA_END=1304 /DNA_ORIENTATION=+